MRKFRICTKNRLDIFSQLLATKKNWKWLRKENYENEH